VDDPLLLAGWLLSLPFIIHLWLRRRAQPSRKLFWSAVLLVPYLGLLFYGALFRPLPPQGKHLEAQENWLVYSSGGHTWRDDSSSGHSGGHESISSDHGGHS